MILKIAKKSILWAGAKGAAKGALSGGKKGAIIGGAFYGGKALDGPKNKDKDIIRETLNGATGGAIAGASIGAIYNGLKKAIKQYRENKKEDKKTDKMKKQAEDASQIMARKKMELNKMLSDAGHKPMTDKSFGKVDRSSGAKMRNNALMDAIKSRKNLNDSSVAKSIVNSGKVISGSKAVSKNVKGLVS